MVVNSKAVVPTVGDNAVALQLSNTGKSTQNALDELRIAAEKVRGYYIGIFEVFFKGWWLG